MNLVAKEYVAAQDPADPGMLVLSDRAGAAYEMQDALLVNPYDTQGIARALKSALDMPLAERRARHGRLLGTLGAHDLDNWSDTFIAALRAAGRRRQEPPDNEPPGIFAPSSVQARQLNG